MPWYYVYADSGPGHQSHHHFYHYTEKPLTKQERREFWEEAFGDRDCPIGNIRLVNFLPADIHHNIRTSLIKNIKTSEERMREEVKRLRNKLVATTITPIGRCSHEFWRSSEFPIKQCPFCHRYNLYGSKSWTIKKPKVKNKRG